MSRRTFLAVLGAAAGGGAAALVAACAGSEPTRSAGPPMTGQIQGLVTNATGAPAGVGRIYLLESSGLNTNTYVDVDQSGTFQFTGLAAGPRKIRFWGGAQYYVPEPNQNPVPVTVSADAPATVHFQIATGTPDPNEREIYIGDDFFQEQPFGQPNATVTVRLGTLVCWYNVGQHQHTVTGGPWGDTGVVDEEFMWRANQVGTFDYRCTFHSPLMRATLQVVP